MHTFDFYKGTKEKKKKSYIGFLEEPKICDKNKIFRLKLQREGVVIYMNI
jgi:hypothetical protein